jgi:hypothetical protein
MVRAFKMRPAAASDFTGNIGNDRLSAQRRSFATEELSDEKVQAIAATRMDPRHDGLNKLLGAE